MFGFRGSALRLMESCLINRYQYTKMGDSKSRKQLIDCDVPQQSSLSPLLFLLYVNDLPQMSQLSTTLFADDTLYCRCLMQIYQDWKTESKCNCSTSLYG